MTDTANTSRPAVTVTPVDPQQFQHARDDKRAATRYAVHVDGVKIGEVGSNSEESWASNGRTRTRKLGYRRYWTGALETNPNKAMAIGMRRADAVHSNRNGCVELLVERYLDAR